MKLKKLWDKIKFAYYEKQYQRILTKNRKQNNRKYKNDYIDIYSDSDFNELDELNGRNHLYTCLLNSYVTHYSENQGKKSKVKWQFYYIVIVSFIVVVLFLIIMSILVTVYFRKNEILIIVSYSSSFLGLLTSLIVIPHTIVKYLFYPKEDEIITRMVIEMQKQDNHRKRINESVRKKRNVRCNKATRNANNK